MNQCDLVECLKKNSSNQLPNSNKGMILALKLSVRGSIALNLNQIIYLLNGKNLTDDDREKLYKDTGYFVNVLLKLKGKESCKSFGLFLELDWGFRAELIDVMMHNRRFLGGDYFTEDDRNNLIKSNSKMVVMLQNLKEFEVKSDDNEKNLDGPIKGLDINAVNSLILANVPIYLYKLVELIEENNKLKEDIDILKQIINDLGTKFINLGQLDTKFIDLNKKMTDLHQNIDQKISSLLNNALTPTKIPIQKRGIFEFEIKGISNIFKSDIIKQNTDIFYCRSLPWFMVFGSFRDPKDNSRYLKMALTTNYLETRDWEVEVEFMVEILNPKTNTTFRAIKDKKHKFSNEKRSKGTNRFVDFKDLVDLGIIDDNKCTIRCSMEVGELCLFNFSKHHF